MNIIQVTNSYKPAWQTGGACRVAYDLSKIFTEKGHHVRVLTTDWGSKGQVPLDSEVVVDGNPVIYYRSWTPTLLSAKMPLPLHPLILGVNGISDADVVHIHDYRSPLAMTVVRQCQRLRVPYIIQMHGSFGYDIGKGRQKKVFDRALGERIIDKAAKIIALTSTEASKLMESGIPSSKIKIIPNGIDPTSYSYLPDAGLFKASTNLLSKRVILYLGRLDETKDVDLLLNAFALCLEDREDIVLVLIGPDDGERTKLEQLCNNLDIRGHVKFMGFVDHKTKLAALADADMIVCPSYSGFPIVFLEACASGRPIITTLKGDKLDWLNEKAGIVTRYSAYDLRTAILRLLIDNKCSQQFGNEGLRLANDEFSLSTIAKRMQATYEEAIRGD